MSTKVIAAIRAREAARAAAARPKKPATPKGATKAEAKKFDQLDEAAKKAQDTVNERAES